MVNFNKGYVYFTILSFVKKKIERDKTITHNTIRVTSFVTKKEERKLLVQVRFTVQILYKDLVSYW